MNEKEKAMKLLLVGSHFHPPAKALLEHAIPAGTEVSLVPEPDNPYDPLAVMVLVAKESLRPPEWFDEILAGFGWSEDDLPEMIKLGHIAASDGKPLAKAQAMVEGLGGNRALALGVVHTGRLEFNGDGLTVVMVEDV